MKENTDLAAMVSVELNWTDFGNWDALLECRSRHREGNAIQRAAELADPINVSLDSDGPQVLAIGFADAVTPADCEQNLVKIQEDAQSVGMLIVGTKECA